MKKLFAIPALCACIFSACTKETPSVTEDEGTPLLLTASFEENDTKVTFGELSGSTLPVLWETGDKFALYTVDPNYYTDLEHTMSNFSTYTEFSAISGGSKTADFTGTIKAGAPSTTNGFAVYPASAVIDEYKADNKTYSGSKTSSETGITMNLIGCTLNIPAAQDGSGAKYLITYGLYNEGVLETFKQACNGFKFNLDAADEVTKIEIETDKAGTVGLAGSYNLYYSPAEGRWYQSGCSDTKVTVENGGAVLSGDVYAITRILKKGDTITIKFTYNGTKAKSYQYKIAVSITAGKIYSLGNIELNKTIITYGSTALTHEGLQFPSRTSKSTYVYYDTAGNACSSETELKDALMAVNGGVLDWYLGDHAFTFHITGTKPYFFPAPVGETTLIQVGKGVYVELPGIAGKKLVSVHLTVNNTQSNTKHVKICNNDADFTPVTGGEEQAVYQKNDASFELGGTTAGTRYILRETDTNNLQIKELKLTYETVE